MDDNYVRRVLDLFAEYGDAPAIEDAGRELSYRELRAEILDTAAVLYEQGVRPGMTVALMVGVTVEVPVLHFAVHLLGCRLAWVTGGSGRREMADYLRVVGPDVLVYDLEEDARARELVDELGSIPVLCVGPGGLGPDLAALRPQGTDPLAVAGGAPESVFQTSGTTGAPKAILHEQSTFDQVVELGLAWRAGGHPVLRQLTVTPMYWSAGTVATMIALCSGGLIILMADWDTGDVLRVFADKRINYVFMSPAMYYDLLDLPGAEDSDLSGMYMLNVGAAPTSPERIRQGLRQWGPLLRITYGLSESPYVAAYARVGADDEHPERINSCGKAWGDVRMQIRDEAGAVLAAGETGDIWVASRLNFSRYLGQPELTEQTLVDGWLRTGDVGHLDESGYLYVEGRSQEMIIAGRGARKIFARPIEDALASHPQVRAAAVIGVADAELTEAVHAFVVCVDEAQVSDEDLRRVVGEQLPDIWVPSTIDFVDSLPRIGFGKVDKKQLRATYAALHPGS